MKRMPKKSQISQSSPLKSKIRPVERTSISDDIVEQILALIASGDLKPGQRLPSERELCKNFNAGRSSLREALRCLSIVGVLTARVGEGTSVAPNGGMFLGKIVEWRIVTEKHDIEDMMQVRIALEGVTAASAAIRGTEEDLAKLQGMISKMEAALDNEKKFAALDLEFHIMLATISKNFLIYDLVALLRGQLEKMLQKVLLLPNAIPLTFKEHVTICNAIKRHDPDAASDAMRRHLESALKRYLDSLAEMKGTGISAETRKASKARKRSAKAVA
jgi:GntR family transcriptional regulator, transcriptional repressor for pyruvate dehydrogenase complex